MKAKLLTIGTEITCGEVVNTNAAWASRQLEELGIRVISHLSVRDQHEEMLEGLKTCTESGDCDVLIVTGGLGPTTDDITRDVLAEWTHQPLEFDDSVWQELLESYAKRGLILREAHRQQCLFPKNSERLHNPVGTALGFYQNHKSIHCFVLPGPPRELEEMWGVDVAPRLNQLVQSTAFRWRHWTNIGVPESEIAELVESVISGKSIEVGYRASIPYVRTKLYLNSDSAEHQQIAELVESKLNSSSIGSRDLAEEFLQRLSENFNIKGLRVFDEVTGLKLSQRLFEARDGLRLPIEISTKVAPKSDDSSENKALSSTEALVKVTLEKTNEGSTFTTQFALANKAFQETKELPYKIALQTGRGRQAATEWILWTLVKALR
jgi:molybdenum cofactor synthesis domain-containing protein